MIMIRNKMNTAIIRDSAEEEGKASPNIATRSLPPSVFTTTSVSSASVPKRFPFRLNDMLNDAENQGDNHIVSWLPDNRMFKVHRHKEFANKIMPLYCRHKQYKSFLRQLSMYKFQRINQGPLRGCYRHPNFERNRFDLIEKIHREDREIEGTKSAYNKAKSKVQKGSTRNSVKQPQQPFSINLDILSHRKGEGDTASCDDHPGSVSDEFELINFSGTPADEESTNDFISSVPQQQQEDKPRQGSPALEFDKPQYLLEQKMLSKQSNNLAAGNAISLPQQQPVCQTMRRMSQQLGLFNVQAEDEQSGQGNATGGRTPSPSRSNSMMPLLASLATSTSYLTVLPQEPLPFLSDAPTDILDEIICTFGRDQSTR